MAAAAAASADGMSSAFSDLFFDSMTGKFSDLREFATNTFKAIARSISDQLGKKVTSEIIGVTGGIGGLFKKKPVTQEDMDARRKELPSLDELKTKTTAAKEVGAVNILRGLLAESGKQFDGIMVRGANLFVDSLITALKQVPMQAIRGVGSAAKGVGRSALGVGRSINDASGNLFGLSPIGGEGIKHGALSQQEVDAGLLQIGRKRIETEQQSVDIQTEHNETLKTSTSSLSGLIGKLGQMFPIMAGGGFDTGIKSDSTFQTGLKMSGWDPKNKGWLGSLFDVGMSFLPFAEGGITNLADSAVGIAKQPTFAAIAEKEPEAITPLSKFAELVKPTTINIQAIDSKSAAQWFGDNKELVMGTLFSNRSNVVSKLSPVSRGPF